MKANELRIGNYVQTKYVTKFSIDRLPEQSEECYNDIQPIPLTEEWLLRMGFEKKKGYYDRYYYNIDGMDIRIDDDMFETEVGECLYKTIKYVHQLQNLYFALNDEELTMK